MKHSFSINESNQIERTIDYYGNIDVNLRVICVVNEKRKEYVLAHADKTILNQLIVYNMNKEMYVFLKEQSKLKFNNTTLVFDNYTCYEVSEAIALHDMIASMKAGVRKMWIDEALSNI